MGARYGTSDQFNVLSHLYLLKYRDCSNFSNLEMITKRFCTENVRDYTLAMKDDDLRIRRKTSAEVIVSTRVQN